MRAAKLNGYEMEVSYENGIATLKGKIADLHQKIKATSVVKRVSGVRKVRNQLVALNKSLMRSPVTNIAAMMPSNRHKVRKASMQNSEAAKTQMPAGIASSRAIKSNQKIANEIAKKLSNAGVEGDIEISFQNGMAMLKGPTTSMKQKAMADRITRSVRGVTMVNNQLMVQGISQAVSTRQPNARQMATPAMYQAQGGPPPQYAHPGAGPQQTVYNNPSLPDHAWPSYAAYPNYAQVAYPKQYSPSAWPYIGPFYPYPQVPLGWRNVKLEWDDGMWNLNFNSKTDRWWWFLSPKNW